MYDPLVAALDEYVSNILAQLQTLSDREQMVLTFCRGVFDKVGIGQLLRMDQHRLGNFDRIVESKRSNELGRGAFHAHEVMGEFGARLDFDVGGKLLEHVIEQCDLLVRIAARSGREEVCNPLKNSQALFGAAGGCRADHLIEQRATFCKRTGLMGRGHG